MLKIAHHLPSLTRKGALSSWTADCETAFDSLRVKLVTTPLLEYPNFDKDLTLEMDANKFGLGAILSQAQDDNRLHLVA